ncbi:MAG: hypothetical protein R6X21_03390 [Candidatus Aminicenantes bacterium]
MRQITVARLFELLAEHEPPCISLYQPTHRHHPEGRQDPIRYKNLLRDMETSLREKYPKREVPELLEKFQAVAGDNRFWNHRTDGLAILGSPDKFEIFEFQRPVKERLIVADTFHVKPLLRMLQSADRFHILGLNRQEAKLYEGNRDVLDPVGLTDVPSTITEALGVELTEPHLTVGSYGLGAGGGGKAMRHGHGSKRDEIDVDIERFFRAIDRMVLEHFSRPSGLPLMLAALAEYHAPFRQVSRNPFLMAEGLQVNPDALSLDELREQAWEKVEPLYLDRLDKLVEGYQAARARDLGSDDLEQVARAAVAGRVGALLVEAHREVPGRIDPATGRFELGDLSDPTIEDALDDLAETVLRMKGTVVVVPAERMPTATGVAAAYRY